MTTGLDDRSRPTPYLRFEHHDDEKPPKSGRELEAVSTPTHLDIVSKYMKNVHSSLAMPFFVSVCPLGGSRREAAIPGISYSTSKVPRQSPTILPSTKQPGYYCVSKSSLGIVGADYDSHISRIKPPGGIPRF